jgi:succinate dehydrogenase / fumarate reductase, membrane anchor subunit
MVVETENRPKTRFTASGARPRPTRNFELWSWLFFRISGILLIFFALGHLALNHLVEENGKFGVDRIDYNFIANRWANPLWRTFDLILLFLALLHGLNGARVLIYDYIKPGGGRVAALATLYSLGVFFLLIGAQVIITFQPK